MSDAIAGILLFLALLGAVFLGMRLVTTLVRAGKIPATWEIRVLVGAALFSAILVILVEVLSLLRLVSAFGLAAGWAFAAVALHVVREKLEGQIPSDREISPVPGMADANDWNPEQRFLRYGIACALAILFAIALIHAPSALDPITRDLNRVLHWLQNGSVSHFSTYDIKELKAAPFEAFAILHAYLLADSDQLAKLVPWIALVLALTALCDLSSQIASRRPTSTKQLPPLRTIKLWSSALALCLLLALNLVVPGQVRFLGAFWILSIAVFGLRLIAEPSNLVYSFLFGMSLGLALLTSETTAIGALLLGLIFVIVTLKQASSSRFHLFQAIAVPLLLLVPHSLRNYNLFDSIGFNLSFAAHLAFVILVTPLIAVTLQTLTLSLRIPVGAFLAGIVVCSILFDKVSPILGDPSVIFQKRERQRFLGTSVPYEPVVQAVNDVLTSGSTNIALYVEKPNEPLARVEYPISAMLKERGFVGNLYYVGITNVTVRLSSPTAPQALLSSAGKAVYSNYRLPYQLNYGPVDTYWSELDSRWVELSQLQRNKSRHVLSPGGQELIAFENGSAILSVRVPRQGVLTLDGGFGDRRSLLPTATALSIKSRAGFITTSRSTNALHVLEIPVPHGETQIQLSPAFQSPAGALFALRSWIWYPTEQPLPFIYVSRISSPTTSFEPNTLIVGAGSGLDLELISGAAGLIDLQFQGQGIDSNILAINTVDFQTNVTFRTGAVTARLPINRGTNHFMISSSSTNTLLLDRIEPRFRDFIE